MRQLLLVLSLTIPISSVSFASCEGQLEQVVRECMGALDDADLIIQQQEALIERLEVMAQEAELRALAAEKRAWYERPENMVALGLLLGLVGGVWIAR